MDLHVPSMSLAQRCFSPFLIFEGLAANDTGILLTHKDNSHGPGGSPYTLDVISWCDLLLSPWRASNASQSYLCPTSPEKLSGCGGVISWIHVNDARCVRGHAVDLHLIEAPPHPPGPFGSTFQQITTRCLSWLFTRHAQRSQMSCLESR